MLLFSIYSDCLYEVVSKSYKEALAVIPQLDGDGVYCPE
jgi:hypothetical protein